MCWTERGSSVSIIKKTCNSIEDDNIFVSDCISLNSLSTRDVHSYFKMTTSLKTVYQRAQHNVLVYIPSFVVELHTLIVTDELRMTAHILTDQGSVVDQWGQLFSIYRDRCLACRRSDHLHIFLMPVLSISS